MENAGTVFHRGPVVNLIVASLTMVEKLHLFRQIEEEDNKRPPTSTSSMSGWKESIRIALDNQRIVRNYIVAGSDYSHYFEEFNCNRRDETDDNCVLPKEWLANKEELERLLVLCSNLTSIHLHIYNDECVFVDQDILDVILSRAKKLTSLTFRSNCDDSTKETLMQILRCRRDGMEYVDVINVPADLADIKECIETMANLETIRSDRIHMDFVGKLLIFQVDTLREFTANGKISELCAYFKEFSCQYKKSSSDGVKLKGIDCTEIVGAEIYDELVDSFTELEYLAISVRPGMDIRRLQVMKNLKGLSLCERNRRIEYVEQLLPNLEKLEQLHLEHVNDSESILQQIHVHSPNLRHLVVFATFGTCSGFAEETMRNICLLPKLEYLFIITGKERHHWKNRNAVDQKRLEFDVELLPSDLSQ